MLKNRSLFYPCSGSDFIEPIMQCIDIVEDFWFVDPRYEGGGSSFHPFVNKHLKMKLSRRFYHFEYKGFNQHHLSGRTLVRKNPYVVVQSSFYFHSKRENKDISVNFCGGLGFNALRSIFDNTDRSLDVFFYRRDSSGEGGSGFYWLDWRLKSVLQRLSKGGLIYSDGSNAKVYFRPPKDGQVSAPFYYKKWYLEPNIDEARTSKVKHTVCWSVYERSKNH